MNEPVAPGFDACRLELAQFFADMGHKYSAEVFMPALAMTFGSGLRTITPSVGKSKACHLLRLTRRHAGLPWWWM